ncbi:GIY-YIG nuclease family protein [Roseivirga sp.]|uniref:GIY-YIG nuclease family protein n=1 Tax=Roseivirga sp. TaxID=1964215 RepID=UPI003B8CF25D
MDKKKILEDIFNNDPLGILNVKPKASSARNADERLSSAFQEINDFVSEHGKEPEPNVSNVAETQLYYRLKSLREDDEKVAMLKDQDAHDILPSLDVVNEPAAEYKKNKPKEINSIDDIFSDDSLGLLGDDAEGLFEFKHTPKDLDRAATDFVAKRKPCKDFDQYEEKLKQVQIDLSKGKRKLIEYKEGNLRPDNYYVHNGILFYLESIKITKKEHYREDGTRVREDGRTRCIFENGTESNMLKRSVEKILYDNGKAVTRNTDEVSEEITAQLSGITADDKEAGFIYVLESLSEDPKITSIKNLFKIGYSKTSVEDRIKNAEKEPTYLMAPVRVMGAWQCYNMNPQKLEQLLHNFFGSSCLDTEITDAKGKRHRPQEWFIAPLPIIEKAIEMIVSGEIVGYRYDGESENIKSIKP